MQRISLIVAAYNVENFIQATLQSVVDQTVAFHEVIVINDASTDRTPEIVRDFVARHPSLKVIDLDQNEGLGEVRNIGMRRATGGYFAFLDGDDLFSEDAHVVMQSALATAPDLGLFNHGRLYSNGKLIPNVKSALLANATHRSESEKKALIGNLNVAWNKVYKRDLIERTNMQFPRGKYEDIRWNFEAIIKAKEIVTHREVIIHYRQRDGSILRSRNRSHFDLFDRWDEVWQMLDEDDTIARSYKKDLEVIRYRSLRTVLDSPHRLPPSAKKEFAARLLKLNGPIANLPKKSRGRLDVLIGYPFGLQARTLLRSPAATSLRRKIKRETEPAVKAIKKFLKKKVWFWIYFNIFVRLPVDKSLVVYQSYWGKKIACNPYAMFQHLVAEHPSKYRHIWVVRPGIDLRETKGNAIHVYEGTLKYLYYTARAGYMINNANFQTELVKREGSVHVETKHGTPLKFMGLDILTKDSKALGNTAAFAKRCGRWDYVISSNPYSSETWRRGFPYSYKVLEAGYPRNDRLARPTSQDIADARAALSLDTDKKVVLYAPTFRPKYKPAAALSGKRAKSAIPDKEQVIAAILAGLKEDEVLAIRDHYFLPTNSQWASDPRVINLSNHASTTDVLLASSKLITDYSSIMFDYALLDRPILILAYDLEEYEEARGTYFDLSEFNPGVFCRTTRALTAALKSNKADKPAAQKHREAFRARFCPWDDGNATERVCNEVFSD